MGLGTGPRVTGQPAPKNRRLLLVGRVAVALLSAILHLLEHQLYPQVVTVTDALKMPFKGLHFLHPPGSAYRISGYAMIRLSLRTRH